MQTSHSTPMLSASAEVNLQGESMEAPSLSNSVQKQRPRRSQSHEPPPLKDRLYTALSRFRYGWNFRSSVDIRGDVPIWLLGRCYYSEERDSKAHSTQDIEGAPPHILAFLDHFHSIVWMTYRTNFPPIRGTAIDTDCGWGCMVRSGQMILATTLDRYLLGNQWRIASSSSEERCRHRQILSWFADSPSRLCPFSLHALMREAVRLGNRPGDWFGPSQLAILIRECVMESRNTHQLLEDLLVYVAHDCTVYYGDILKLYGERDDQSLMLLVPVRLGSETLNPIYIPCVKSLLALDHCVGIIGGKPKHSVYFVGFQEEKLVHLDPHYCQVASNPPKDTRSYRDFDVKTYHCNTPRKLSAARMDPSCTIGFLCSNLQEFHKLREQAEKLLAPPLQKGVYPFFSFSDFSLEEMLDASVNMHLGSLMDNHLLLEAPSPQRGRGRSKQDNSLDGLVFCDDEDFVVVECVRRESESLVEGTSLTGSEEGGRELFADYLTVVAPKEDVRPKRDKEGEMQGVAYWSGVPSSSSYSGHTSTAGNHGHTSTAGNHGHTSTAGNHGHTSTAGNHDHTSTAGNHVPGNHLGYLDYAPGRLPSPPPLNFDSSLPTDADPFS